MSKSKYTQKRSSTKLSKLVEEMREFGIPFARVTSRRPNTQDPKYDLVEVDCPSCMKTHHHGALSGERFIGTRVSHCHPMSGQYYVIDWRK